MTNTLQDFVLGIICLTFGAILYFQLKKTEHEQNSVRVDVSGSRNHLSVLLRRFIGILIYGMVPLTFIVSWDAPLGWYGLAHNSTQSVWLLTLTLMLLVLGISYWNSRQKANLDMYPEIRMHKWPVSLLLKSGTSWFLYILAYEWLFRGLILGTSLELFPWSAALVLNVSLYVLVHLPKGWKESLASIPFGFLMCWLVWKSGSVWPAVVLHASLALSTEWFSLYHHPDMSVQWR